MENSCYINDSIQKRNKVLDGAFMGITHASSALAVFLVIYSFFPETFTTIFATSSIWAIILACVVVVGFSLVPDLDNTTSTAKNSLGIIGGGISFLFRTTSAMIQTTIRTGRDDPDPNPHRGFYHTWPSCVLIAALVFLGTKIGGSFTVPVLGEITGGIVFAIIITWMSLQLALASLGKNFLKSFKNKSGGVGEIIVTAGSLLFTIVIFANIPKDHDMWWLAISAGVGCLIHILGDLFTTAGVPIWFPFPHKGKLWWTTRLTKMKAGSWTERMIIAPFFSIVCIVSIVNLVLKML